eukprot:30676-Chlamydomonas_euryale.AAC.5
MSEIAVERAAAARRSLAEFMPVRPRPRPCTPAYAYPGHTYPGHTYPGLCAPRPHIPPRAHPLLNATTLGVIAGLALAVLALAGRRRTPALTCIKQRTMGAEQERSLPLWRPRSYIQVRACMCNPSCTTLHAQPFMHNPWVN